MKDQFQSAIKMYKNKYDLNAGGMNQFLNSNIDASAYQITEIQNKINQLQLENPYSDQSMRIILHIISSVQNGQKTMQLSKKQLQQYKQITFKSSKKNEKKKKIEQSNKLNEDNKIKQEITMNKQQKKLQNYYQIPYQEEKNEKFINNNVEKVQNNNSYNKKNIINQQQKNQNKIKIKQINQIEQYYDKRNSLSPKKKSNQLNINLQNITLDDNIKQCPTKSIIRAVSSVNANLGMIRQDQAKQQASSQIVYDENNTNNNINRNSNDSNHSGHKISSKANFMSIDQKQIPSVIIEEYNKFNQDYINIIIKYKICHNNHCVWRRYSEFQKLMVYLNRRYQGIILPELPPKEGIRSNLSYFYGLDKEFLNKRQNKLEQLLNRLLQNKFVHHDQILIKFLDEADYQLQSQDFNHLNYLKSLSQIAFNAKEIKDYGLAYYNYVRENHDIQLKEQIVMEYDKIKEIIVSFEVINQYRIKINEIYDRRREIMNNQKLQCRIPQNTRLDKMLDLISTEIKNMHTEYNRYVTLKSTQSWYKSLIKQKNDQPATKYFEDIKKNLQDIQNRLIKMQINLQQSMKKFQSDKEEQIKKLGIFLIEWKKKAHP